MTPRTKPTNRQDKTIPSPNPTRKASVIAIIVGKYTNNPSTIMSSYSEQVLVHLPLSVVDVHIQQEQE